jgi:multidrug efflux pump subunit AcrA (membrane-fusion protein)
MLSPGMFVRIRAPIGGPHQALLIPEQALSTDQGQRFVYVVTPENKVDVRYVRVGALRGQLREIQQGLKPDERVIVSGLQQVRRDVKVQVMDRTQGSGVRNQESGAKGLPAVSKDKVATANSH